MNTNDKDSQEPKRKVGRPSEYNFELCKEILELVAKGMNIITALESDERFPSWPCFREWKFNNDELDTLYLRAIRDKAQATDQQIDQIMQEVKSGIIDDRVAKVLIDTLKWKAAKYYPKMFGEHVDLTSDQKPLSVNISDAELNDRVRKATELLGLK